MKSKWSTWILCHIEEMTLIFVSHSKTKQREGVAILVTYKQASINFERRWSSLGGLPLATNVAWVENTAMANC